LRQQYDIEWIAIGRRQKAADQLIEVGSNGVPRLYPTLKALKGEVQEMFSFVTTDRYIRRVAVVLAEYQPVLAVQIFQPRRYLFQVVV
jgi:hypothetical protein